MMKVTLNNMKFESPASSLLQYLSAALSIKKGAKPDLYKAENFDVIVWWAYTKPVEGTLLSSLIFRVKTPIWLPRHQLDSRTRLAFCSKQDPEGEASGCANLPSCQISLLLSLVSKLLEIHSSPWWFFYLLQPPRGCKGMNLFGL